jgi:hypothetical protein
MAMRWLAPQVAVIVLAAALGWERFSGLDGTEFSGGWLTGPMLIVHFGGTLLMTFALPVAFAYPRVAAAMMLAAVLFCLPLHLYFLVPGAFFASYASVPVDSFFRFVDMDFCSIVALAAATLVAVLLLRKSETR